MSITLVAVHPLDLQGNTRVIHHLLNSNPRYDAVAIPEISERTTMPAIIANLHGLDPNLLQGMTKEFKSTMFCTQESTVRAYLENNGFLQTAAWVYCTAGYASLHYADSFNLGLEESLRPNITYKQFLSFLQLNIDQALQVIEAEYAQRRYPVSRDVQSVQFYKERDQHTALVLEKLTSRNRAVCYLGYLPNIFGDYHPNLHDLLPESRAIKLNTAGSVDSRLRADLQ